MGAKLWRTMALAAVLACGLGLGGSANGETELTRLFYRLGWTTGWYKGADRHKRYGELATEGGPRPDWRAVKAKLGEMAQKYDQAA